MLYKRPQPEALRPMEIEDAHGCKLSATQFLHDVTCGPYGVVGPGLFADLPQLILAMELPIGCWFMEFIACSALVRWTNCTKPHPLPAGIFV